MSAPAIGAIVFICVFGGALLGMFLRQNLPEEHLNADSRDVIKLTMATVATLSALVLGLLTASAKSSLDDKESELRSTAAKLVLLDRTMAEYGPETRDARDSLKQLLVGRLRQIWPEEESGAVAPTAIEQGVGEEAVQGKLLALSPKDDAQRWLQSKALEIGSEIATARWSLVEQIGSGIQWPFLIVVVFWLSVVFISFGLFAPGNPSVLAAFSLAALSVAGSIYLILEMDQPYSGLIKIPSDPYRVALGQLGR